MSLICNHCNKNFKSKENYKNHILFCEIVYKNQKERQEEYELNEDIPSISDIFKITKQLVVKYDKLQHDYNNLKQLINNRKKKINVVDWLNINCKPDINFIEWYNNLSLKENHLEYIFSEGNIDGLSQILQELCSDISTLPIKCFTQKENTFYIYENNIWKIISNNELNLFFGSLNKQILNLFKIWQEKNTSKLEDDNFAIEYIQKVRKILGKNDTIEVENIKLKNKFYKFLKVNIKTIIEYDFS
jgi:hypothetical protein